MQNAVPPPDNAFRIATGGLLGPPPRLTQSASRRVAAHFWLFEVKRQKIKLNEHRFFALVLHPDRPVRRWRELRPQASPSGRRVPPPE